MGEKYEGTGENIVLQNFHSISCKYISIKYISSKYLPRRYISSKYVSRKYISSDYISCKYMSSKYISSRYISNKYISNKYIASKYISIEMGYMSERDGSDITSDLERTFWCAGSIQNNLKTWLFQKSTFS